MMGLFMERKSFGKPAGVERILFTLFLGAMPTEAETVSQQSVGEQALMLAQAPEAGKQPQPGEAKKTGWA